MTTETFKDIFTPSVLQTLFQSDRANRFFEALYGDAKEGAYDISLEFKGQKDGRLMFEFHLKQRRGKCLACNLTYGLPTVFSRHPVIDVKGLVQEINRLLDGKGKCAEWKIGKTREASSSLHIIPLTVSLIQ